MLGMCAAVFVVLLTLVVSHLNEDFSNKLKANNFFC